MGIPSASAQDSICARVKIEILQELTLERQAFEGRMTINNGLVGTDLDSIQADINFADRDGNPVIATSNPNDTSARFFFRLQTGSSIPASIPGGSNSKITWLIIPSRGAGGSIPQGQVYFVGATLRYRAAGEKQEVKVSPDSITVKPLPNLALDYFLPSGVEGDDPFTDSFVEPVVPFNLGVRVRNTGFGPGRSVKIESAQPRIIENKQGLLIDFRIIGSEVNGSAATTSLLADFGDILPNRSGVARWIMTCTLSGRFVEFNANYTHSDELGGQVTSLLQKPRTHFLVHDVLVDLQGRDGVRDFLAKDGDVLRVYESENADTEVADLSAKSSISGSVDRYVIVPPLSGGFSWIRLPDPTHGTLPLLRVLRADGKSVALPNAWISQTFDRVAKHWDYFVNVFDANNPSGLAYTVQYAPPVNHVNRPPALDPLNNWVIDVGSFLAFPITSSDPDGDSVRYTMTSAPSGSKLNPTTGLFQWRPKASQAPTTNLIRVTATDNGSPPLSDTREFSVIVNPVLGFELTLGSTNIFSGESNAIPLLLKSALSLTNVSFTLPVALNGGVTNLNLGALAPEVFSSSVSSLGGNRYALNLEVDPNRIQGNARTLGFLGFESIVVKHSSIVPLRSTNLVGRAPDGRAITNGIAHDGRVVVFASEPVLIANPDRTLALYGRPGASYAIDSRSGLDPSLEWNELVKIPLNHRFESVRLETMDPRIFYRAREFDADPALLLWPNQPWPEPLLVYGVAGKQYTLESTADLGNSRSWARVTTFELTNSWRYLTLPSTAEAHTFFRIR